MFNDDDRLKQYMHFSSIAMFDKFANRNECEYKEPWVVYRLHMDCLLDNGELVLEILT